MKPPVPFLTDEVWCSLCEPELVRPSVVAAGRARLVTNDWPAPLDVADALILALIDEQPRLLAGIS